MEVRRLGPGDEDVLRSVRRRALETDPDAFASTLAREEALPPEGWTRRLGPPGVTVVAGAADDEPAGMAWGVPDGPVVHLYGMWVAPEARRAGAGGALVDAVVAWAEERGAAEVELTVVEGNAAAESLYRGRGFRRTGVVERTPDGRLEAQMVRPL